MSQAESPSAVDTEKGLRLTTPINRRYKPSPDEEACHYLWNTYIGQAQDYDKALLEGWKGDMDGMVIFSALYSAVLTALLVESYQKLQEDPADATVAILIQVSQQLALLSNGTVFTYESRPPFELETAYVVCNTFWFLALALALTCSLFATFVQQWVRDFLHKTTVQRSPVAQARVLAFLYFGLRRFGMHTFVDVIPILLHISLLFFFAGLVAFLQPINRLLTYLMVCILGVFLLVYMSLSCIPLLYLDAPYRTPVSDFIWRLGNRLHSLCLRRSKVSVQGLSLTEAMLQESFKKSEDRDQQCMKFTMKSLNSDAELLPMFQAIPEAVIRSPTEARTANLKFITPILQSTNPNENIISRISAFITLSGYSADPVRQKSGMETSLKALWSLARLVIDHEKKQLSMVSTITPVFWFDRGLLTMFAQLGSVPMTHVISALALVRTSRLQSLKRCIDLMADKLSTIGPSVCEQLRTAKVIFEGVSLDDIHWTSGVFRQHFSELRITLRDGCVSGLSETRAQELVTKARDHVSQLQCPSRWKAALISILEEFLSSATRTRVIPFEIGLTHDLIYTSIPRVDFFEQTVEVEDDEVEASLLLQNISDNPRDVPEEVFRLVFRLAFSTKRALLCQKCRGVTVRYLSARNSCSWPMVIWDDRHNVEQCVLQDIRTDDSLNCSLSVILIRAIYYGMGLTTSSRVPSQLRDFAMQFFELIPTTSKRFTQTHWWNAIEVYTEWVLCKDVLSKLDDLTGGTSNNNTILSPDSEIIGDLHSLGQRVLPGFQIPEYPSSGMINEYGKWAEDIKTYVMSINLLILSKLTLLNTDGTDNKLAGDWVGMQPPLYSYSGHIYDSVQLQFAKSVHHLVSMHPWNQPKHHSSASLVFHEYIWRLSVRNWCWITNVESAKILLEAIQCHKNDTNYRGWLWFEQELFNRCKEVIREAEAQSEELY